MKQLEHCFPSQTDFYKFCHWLMYPKGMKYIYSYGEARNGACLDEVKFYGMIPILREFFEGVRVTTSTINIAAALVEGMGGFGAYFNREMWEHIRDNCGGKLPLLIKALPEGSVVKPGTPLFTIEVVGDEKTKELCVPLVGHSETLLMHVWSTTTIASVGHYLRRSVRRALERAGLGKEEVDAILPYMVHDFGYRGVSSNQTAGMLGMAFLSTGAKGTDTTEACRYIQHYYETDVVYGKSVWATEHSVATSFGPGRGEYEYLLHQLCNAPDDAIVSIVIDSYDTMNFIENVVGSDECAEPIKAREGRTVFRPDSGDMFELVPNILEALAKKFGYTVVNGYKVLNHNIGVLQGDGMDIDSIPALYDHIMNNGWSPVNLVVGSGGGLLQKWNRDSLRFAIKASHGAKVVHERVEEFDIFKDPVTANTGNETKASKRGRLKVQGNLTISSATTDPVAFAAYEDDLVTVFNYGEIPKEHINFDAVIERQGAA